MALCSRLQMKPMCYLLKESAELKKKKKEKEKRKENRTSGSLSTLQYLTPFLNL